MFDNYGPCLIFSVNLHQNVIKAFFGCFKFQLKKFFFATNNLFKKIVSSDLVIVGQKIVVLI